MLAAMGGVVGWLFYFDLAAALPGVGRHIVVAGLAAAAGLVLPAHLPRGGEPFTLPRDVCGYAPIMLLIAGSAPCSV